MPDLQLQQIIERVDKIPGWLYHDQMEFLYPLAQKANKIFEIGTFAGKSTLFWTLSNPEAEIITTDLCVGVHGNGIPPTTILPEVVKSGKIIALHEDSHELVKRFNIPMDIVFVDGDHSYSAVCRDITDWLPKTKILVCHDYMDVWPEVKQACDNCLRGKYELLTDQFGLFVVKV